MKKLLHLCLVFCITNVFSQVGIGTTTPTADLDVNGSLRVRTSNTTTNTTAAKDSILVTDNLGNVKRISAKTVIESHLKTFVKGAFLSSSTDVSLALLAGTKMIPFDFEEFDMNSEFDTSTSVFTAKQAGIYEVSVQIKATSAIAISTNFGVTVLKNGTIINRNSFANIGIDVLLATVNVTPPLRNINTLVSLNTGDTISFNVVASLASLSLVGNREDCYFTIHQVR